MAAPYLSPDALLTAYRDLHPVRIKWHGDYPFPEMKTPPMRSPEVNNAAAWWYWYDVAPDLRHTLKELCDVLGIVPYMALRTDQVWEGFCELQWPGCPNPLPATPVSRGA